MVEMKKVWSRPLTVVQNFEANEYVAACWKIKCNVPYGIGFYDTNGNNQYDEWDDEYIARGYGCGTYHIGVQSDNGPVANAMWQPRKKVNWGFGEENDGDAYPVFMFVTGRGNNDHHFSKVEDAEWETNPNAS